MKIVLSGVEESILALEGFKMEAQARVVAKFEEIGKAISADIKAELGRRGRASTPGEAPSTDEGHLIASIGSKVLPLELGKPITLRVGQVNPTATKASFYGFMLEYGTSGRKRVKAKTAAHYSVSNNTGRRSKKEKKRIVVDGVGIAPRPWLAPVIAAWSLRIDYAIRECLEDAARDFNRKTT